MEHAEHDRGQFMGRFNCLDPIEPLCQMLVITAPAPKLLMPFAHSLNDAGDAADGLIRPFLQTFELALAVRRPEKPCSQVTPLFD